MIHCALEGNLEEAKKMHYQMLPLMNMNFIESNPIPVKAAMSMMNFIENSLRLPLTTIEEKNKLAVEKVLKDLKLV
jgi:4-hydroxy-tetrahydrodipicolinate synthase